MDVRRYIEISRRIHAVIFASGLLLLILVVGTVFVESAVKMEPTGYSIFDFQGAWTKQRSDQILSAWTNILGVVIIQTYWDYFFILGNVLLSLGLLGFLGNILMNKSSRNLALLGIGLSMIGGLFDALENIWTILILTNPNSYPEIWIQLVSFFAQSKFIISYFKYSIIFCILILVILEKIRGRKKPT
jgi:hypothetical protein